jgi:hypothetical protein
MFRREVLLKLGGFEESFRGLFEDQVIRAKVYLNGPVFVSDHVFDRYRQHDESCFRISKATGQSEEPRRQFLIWLSQYLDTIGHRGLATRWQLRRKMLRSRYPSIHRAWSRGQAVLRRVVGRGSP